MLKKIINKILGKPNDIMSFKAGYDLTQLPIVTFHQGEKRLNFLLDTGSNSCVIDSNVLKHIQHTMVANDPEPLMGLDGNKMAVNKCEITLYFNDRGYTYEYLIHDMSKPFGEMKKDSGVTLHGILGSKFFNRFKYVLDFDELIAYSKT